MSWRNFYGVCEDSPGTWFCGVHTHTMLIKRVSTNNNPNANNGKFWCPACLSDKMNFQNALASFRHNWRPMRKCNEDEFSG